MTPSRELLLQLQEVLDDAVMDHDDAAGFIAVGVRVYIGGQSMRGPAGMANADCPTEGRITRRQLFQLRQLASRLSDLDVPIVQQRHAR